MAVEPLIGLACSGKVGGSRVNPHAWQFARCSKTLELAQPRGAFREGAAEPATRCSQSQRARWRLAQALYRSVRLAPAIRGLHALDLPTIAFSELTAATGLAQG